MIGGFNNVLRLFFENKYYSKITEGYCTMSMKWFNLFTPFYCICVFKNGIAITNDAL